MAEASIPATKPRSEVTLIPWDPDSKDHVERLYQQRLACGWSEDRVENWRVLQREGKMAIHWILLSPKDPNITTKLSQHTTTYPNESTPILDTAISLGNKPRTPTNTIFQPVGHISLDSAHTDLRLANAEEGIYCISTFYVSKALQSSGLGRAAMDIVERMAVEEPLNARVLTLHTAKNEYEGRREKWEAMGVDPPKVSNQDWYTRRGYEVFDVRNKYYWSKDPTGKSWPITAVFMRKTIA